METKPENKLTGSTVAITGAIITAIAGIITTIVSISGPIIDKQLAIQITQTREAFLIESTRVAGIAVQVNNTPAPGTLPLASVGQALGDQPTFTAAPVFTPADQPPQADLPMPTAAPAFTPTPASAQPPANSAPSETFLKVGESWEVGNGIIVQLYEIEVPVANEVHLKFAFTNTTSRVINVKLNHNRDVTLTDDRGNVYKWASDFIWEVNIQPGTVRKDEVKTRGDASLAKYFIVKVELPELGSAQWKE